VLILLVVLGIAMVTLWPMLGNADSGQQVSKGVRHALARSCFP